MSNLNRAIERLATNFAQAVLAAVKGASLTDVAGLTGGVARAKRGGGQRAWPKCQTCGRNAHPRGKGYCWEHALAAGVAKGSGGPLKAQRKKSRKPAGNRRG